MPFSHSVPSYRDDIDLAIDLGTANTRVLLRDQSLAFDEPSVCCFAGDRTGNRLLAVGFAAKEMQGRTFGDQHIVRPLRDGIVHDLDAGRELLKHAIRESLPRRRFGAPRALIGIPADATKAEYKALLTIAQDAGLRGVEIVAEPVAAALGCGISGNDPRGSLLIECGAGTTEIAVLASGRIALRKSLRGGGFALNTAFIDYMHSQHSFRIGDSTAEKLKLETLARINSQDDVVEVAGLNVERGRPERVNVPILGLSFILERYAIELSELVADILNDVSPAIYEDIVESGVVLTGGGAVAPILVTSIGCRTRLNVRVADDPLACVSKGLGEIAFRRH
ncbi:rod shape-determining protein [Pacificimonas flava]|uniref:rod shape-determining protein n=1 Tax=Pacificimonas flava TaxID=1234595 RepID=UPI00056DCD66|nr:rod shape-determining protein [Pacificimonas flava]MBB5281827.1 rod shape-determining protein MreB [Pacificimonas flava]